MIRWAPSVAFVTLLFVGRAASAESEWQYTVIPGDTLSQIAERYLDRSGLWTTLQKLNRIQDPDKLTPGSSLRIPYSMSGKNVLGAEVVWYRGQVDQITNGNTNPLKTGDQLRVGDLVVTGAASSATLRFSDDSRIMIGASSRCVLTRMVRDPRSNQVFTTITVESGTVESIVQRSEKVDARYEVRTPTMNLAVRGTRFRVMVDSVTGMTRSEVSEGTVAASAQGKEIIIGAGQGTFAMKGQPPAPARNLIAAPSLVYPTAMADALPIRFDWDAGSDTRQYRIELLDGSGQRQIDELTSLDSIARWASLPDGEYQIRVRGVDAAGLDGMSVNHAFVLKAQPSPPILRHPIANAVVEGDRVAFRWARPTGIHSYRLQISDKDDFSNVVSQMKQLPGSIGGIDIALPAGRYFWRIASATKDAGLGPESAVASFELRSSSAPMPPSVARVPLSWKPAHGTTKTQVQVALSPDFRTPLLDTTQTGNMAEFSSVGKGPYFVRLRRIDTDGLATPFDATQQLALPEAR